MLTGRGQEVRHCPYMGRRRWQNAPERAQTGVQNDPFETPKIRFGIRNGSFERRKRLDPRLPDAWIQPDEFSYT